MGMTRADIDALLVYLALYVPAPEGAPADWHHHGDENYKAWQTFVREAKERGYYAYPADKGRAAASWDEEPDRERHWHCSACGTVQGVSSIAMKYCPECGARMAEHPWAASGCGQAFSPD